MIPVEEGFNHHMPACPELVDGFASLTFKAIFFAFGRRPANAAKTSLPG